MLLNRNSAGVSQAAIARPAIAPAIASTALSANSCRTMTAGEAPIACLTANSRERSVDRTSNRFATLAQAINSTNNDPAHQKQQRLSRVGEVLAWRAGATGT